MNDILSYYRKKESRWGYRFLLKGVRHFGYYPDGRKTISHARAQELMVDRIADEFNLSQGSAVLDAGCGEGMASMHLAARYGFRVSGVDLLPESIEYARKYSAQNSVSNVNFIIGSYDDLPFSDNSFDGIFTLETLVHSPNIIRTLAELTRTKT